MEKIRKIILIFAVLACGICLLLAAVSAVSNLGLPQGSISLETLSESDKVRLAEALHLRQSLGESVWTGWGQADIPVILYNENYAFLVGYPQPPPGWVKVPAGIQRGSAWDPVPGDSFEQQTYYRQRLPGSGITPEAFTVLVGDHWVSSLQILDWAKISLVQTIRQDLPAFLRPIFPYRLFLGQLIEGSDQYISLMEHEAFHAFQGSLAAGKFSAAENASSQYASQYSWEDAFLQADWQQELELLADALQSSDDGAASEIVRRFLDTRSARRGARQIAPQLAAYEQQREWLEGLARYAELEIWRQADSGKYVPIASTEALADFKAYAGFAKRWSQEINQMKRMADDEGDGRFYYSGMAQAFLLDRLLPGWKVRAFEDGVWLEDLLAEAVSGR